MESLAAPRPRTITRIVVALAIGALSAVIVVFLSHRAVSASDFDQNWAAARALRAGTSPYDVIGPGRWFEWPWPYFYPLTASLVALPVSFVSVVTARAVFLGASAALLAYAVTRDGYHRLLLFASVGFWANLLRVQWSPLLTAAALLPAIGGVFAAKPTIGLALFAGYPSRRALIGGAVLVAASLLVMPSWPGIWWAITRDTPHIRAPLTVIGGPLVLLALLRWRRPEARLLAALACVPQSLVYYETMPLFLVPTRWFQSAALAGLSWLSLLLLRAFGTYHTTDEFFVQVSKVIVLLMYIPCVLMVLARPNRGELPGWIERIAAAAWSLARHLAARKRHGAPAVQPTPERPS